MDEVKQGPSELLKEATFKRYGIYPTIDKTLSKNEITAKALHDSKGLDPLGYYVNKYNH